MNIVRTALLLLLIIIPVFGLPSAAVSSQSDLTVTESKAIANYPHSIEFLLELENGNGITDIRLNYRVERDSFATVISEAKADFNTGQTKASWTWDMYKTGNPPPGTAIEFWWKLADRNGFTLTTESQVVYFDDTNHNWQQIKEDNLTLLWYQGSQSFAQELMLTAQEGLAKLESDTGASLVKPVDIYIYASSGDLQNAMLFVQDWAGGLAFTGHSTVAMGINPSNINWGKRAMVHELAHLVTHQMTFNPYNSIPIWLNEGISMYAEGKLGSYSESYLYNAVLSDSLISVQSLSSPFSAHADNTHLSYAQSYSLVEFLILQYGPEKMSELLETFRLGSSYDDALLDVYGFDTNGLDEQWQTYIKTKYGVLAPETMGLHPVIILLSVAGGVLAPFYMYLRCQVSKS